ncbi:MAG: hypothetical protein ACE5HB_01680, partial [Terriglobia bacterium]
RSRIRGSLGAGRSSLTESPGFALALHLVAVAFVLVVASARWTPPLVILPFALAALRAAWGRRQAGRKFSVQRLAWGEVALSLVFASLLTLSFRL